MKKLLKIALLLGVAWIFVACGTPKFSENSPFYYDKEAKLVKMKQGACALRFSTKLDLSRLTQKEKEQYFGRFALNNNPDFCYNGKVSQITMYLTEINYNIPCTCAGQIISK